MTPEEEWQANQQHQTEQAALRETATRERLDANRASLAATLARQPAEIAAIQHHVQVARMGGGTLNPDGTSGPPQPDPSE